MKIKCFGARGQTCQIDRIEDGFKELNHEILEEKAVNADLVYSNNLGMHKKALWYAQQQKKRPKVILNILDIPPHHVMTGVFKIAEAKEILKQADAITAISKTVKDQIKHYFHLNADVIYNPAKNVHKKRNQKKIDQLMYVGRAGDPNKRFTLVVQAMASLGIGKEHLKVCGSESVSFGDYLGVVDDEKLNDLYNESKIVFLPSKFEGIGLPMIEALITGTIPITCSDNPTAHEFCPKEFIVEPNPVEIARKIVEIIRQYEKYQKITNSYGNNYKKIFKGKSVAEKILKVYKELTK